MRILLLLVTLILPTYAAADPFPALYEVTGVEKDDVLNIREAPDASALSIASLPPDAEDIEVIALDETGKWGWINTGEGSGWVAMRFMSKQFAAGNTLLPRPLICFGTEPFWNINVGTGPIAEFDIQNEATRQFFGLWIKTSSNRTDHYAVMAENPTTDLSAFINRTICSDGMTDRIYGLGINLLIRNPNETQFYSGCCTITPEAN